MHTVTCALRRRHFRQRPLCCEQFIANVQCYEVLDPVLARAGAAAAEEVRRVALPGWDCATCSLRNAASRASCDACGELCPGAWPCDDCEAVNVPGGNACASCGAVQKPALRVEAAEAAGMQARPIAAAGKVAGRKRRRAGR